MQSTRIVETLRVCRNHRHHSYQNVNETPYVSVQYGVY